MNSKTSVSNNLVHKTKFIDPRSGRVLSEGTTPTATVKNYRENPQPKELPTPENNVRIDKLENDISEIKALLVESLKK